MICLRGKFEESVGSDLRKWEKIVRGKQAATRVCDLSGR